MAECRRCGVRVMIDTTPALLAILEVSGWEAGTCETCKGGKMTNEAAVKELEAILDELAAARDELHALELSWLDIEAEIIPQEVRERLEAAHLDWDARVSEAQARVDDLHKRARAIAEALARQTGDKVTVRGSRLMAVGYHRVSWDGKKLQRLAADYPAIMTAQRVTVTASIRPIQQKEKKGGG